MQAPFHPLRTLVRRSHRTFTTHHNLRKPSSNSSRKEQQDSGELPKTSWKELAQLGGASRSTRIVVFGFIAIMATAETFTWGRFIWAKMKGREEEKEVESG